MFRMHAIFRATDGATFDWESWRKDHLKLAKEKLTPYGLVSLTAQRCQPGPDSKQPSAVAIITLDLQTETGLKEAFATLAPGLIAHVPTFSNIAPLFTFGEIQGLE